MGQLLLVAAMVLCVIRLYRVRYRELDAWAVFLLTLAVALVMRAHGMMVQP